MAPVTGGNIHYPLANDVIPSNSEQIRIKRSYELSSGGKALYLFAGSKRHSSIGEKLRRHGWTVLEVDILQGGRKHDLTLEKVQEQLLQRLRVREFDALLTSPPCDTFSRVKFSNSWGPRPTRTATFPRGLPNCTMLEKRRNQLANSLVDFNFCAIKVHLSHPDTMLVLEFPEDLGAISKGKWTGTRPSSIFQWPQFAEILQLEGVITGGIRQNDFGTDYVKPTRLILRFNGPWDWPGLFKGPPCFDDKGFYVGPIPPTKGKVTLAKKDKFEPFRTTLTAAWPDLLCDKLTALMVSGLQHRPAKRIRLCTAEDSDVRGNDAGGPNSRDDKLQVPKEKFQIIKPPDNYWIGGTGCPRMTKGFGKETPFHDGCGLTSPGRWHRRQRKYPEGRRWDDLRSSLLGILQKDLDEAGLLRQISGLACGVDVYCHRWVVEARTIMHQWMGRQSGSYDAKSDPVIAPGQPFYLDLLFGLLCEVRDADYLLFKSLHEGVPIGVLSPLPHVPALYEPQVKWRLQEDLFLQAKLEKANYASVEEHTTEVEAQFVEEEKLGWMERMTDSEFVKRFGLNRAVSALAVLVEPDKIRVLHDGTHDTRVNNRIRVRDRQRMPTVREMQFLLDEQRQEGCIAFGLLADASKAHRRILVHPSEHGLLGCRLKPGEVWINKVGTFGISSASYWWGRVASAIFRLMFAVLGGNLSLDLLLFADDSAFIAKDKQERWSILLAVTILLAWGMPFKWKKFRGGYQVSWVGFGICFRTYSMGLTEARAQWVAGWSDKLIKSGKVEVAEMRSGLGRLSYAAQALIYERAFLGMLYLWTTAICNASAKVVTIPWAVRLILAWISRRMKLLDPAMGGRLQPAPSFSNLGREWFRTDAKAEDGRAFIGGWEILGDKKVGEARWYALEIKREEAPWVFEKQRDPQRIIAALELLATMVAMVLFDPEARMGGRTNCVMTSSTDNKGNTYIVSKLASTKWPITTLLIELSEQLRIRSALMELTWRNRNDNVEADALTNQDYTGFDERLRISCDFKNIKWLVLPEIMGLSVDLYREVQEQRLQAKSSKIRRPKTSGRRGLKWTDPW